MTDGTGAADDSPSVEGLTRRSVLRLAGLVGLLSEGAAAEMVGDADGDSARSALPPAVAATRRASVEGTVGRWAAAVDVEDTTALVGVPPAPGSAGPTDGRAAILERDGGRWTQQTTLRPDGDDGQFGRAVALDGTTAAVGGELGPDPTGDHSGTVAVFVREGEAWHRQATLSGSGAGGVDRFGTAVDAAGDTVLVGASTAAPGGGRGAGTAFVFTRDGGTWTRAATLTPPAGALEEFGRAVALDGDIAVVGAAREASEGGVAVVYHRVDERWQAATELSPPRGHRNDGFGSVLAVEGTTVLAGAPGESNARGVTAGGAHVFDGRGGEYRRVATLRDRDGGPTKQFGSALALDDGVALVGTRTGVGPHVFGRTTDGWARVNTLRTAERDAPGAPTAVALDGSRAVVGVSRPDRLDDGGGSVEVFEP